MRIVVVLVGTIFLIGNLSLNADEGIRRGLSFDDLRIKEETQQGTIEKQIADKLVALGLEEATATKLVERALAHYDALAKQVEAFVAAVGGVDYQALLNDISKSLLFAKDIDFCNYDYLIGLSHRLDIDLTPERLDKIKTLCNATGEPLDI